MKIKITTLSPLHISGEIYDLGFNAFKEDNHIYLLDEFKTMEFFIEKFNDNVNYETTLKDNHKLIINNSIYKRKIPSNFNPSNLIAFIDVNNILYIPGSEIKGAIRTAILNCLFNIKKNDYNTRCGYLFNKLENKKFSKERINKTLDKDLVEIFKNIIIRDAIKENVKTKIYQTINMKKDRNHQQNRRKHPLSIANYVECIEKKEEFVVEIIDKRNYLQNIGKICNAFYIPKINQDINYYFYKKGSIDTSKLKCLGKNKFLLKIGRFTGAESKSLDNVRYIPTSHCNDKTKTSAVTFARDEDFIVKDKVNDFVNKLEPFGWVVCEIIE